MGKVLVTLLKPDRPVTPAEREATIRRITARCKLDPETGCMLWQGHRNRKGYGEIGFQGRTWMVHRLAWVLVKGPLPPDMFVCHKCDRPNCCTVAHFFLGDHTANQRDMVAKKRHAKGRKTHCYRGHPLSGDNLRISKSGFRTCLTCNRIRLRLKAGWPVELAESMPAVATGKKPVNARWIRGSVSGDESNEG